MNLKKPGSRIFTTNLFADFILSKIDKKENSIIQVTDCGPFMVINGVTSSDVVLDIEKIKTDFSSWFGDKTPDFKLDKLNTIDVIKYEEEVKTFDSGWFELHRDVFVSEDVTHEELVISSEFPYGYSFSCGRLPYYYSHYIFNHMYSMMNTDKVKFYYTTEQNEDEDFKIDLETNSRTSKEDLISLVLDVFDFDLDEFSKKIDKYEFYQDVVFQNKDKSYLIQDRLKDVVLI